MAAKDFYVVDDSSFNLTSWIDAALTSNATPIRLGFRPFVSNGKALRRGRV